MAGAGRPASAFPHHTHFEIDALKSNLLAHMRQKLKHFALGHRQAVELQPQWLVRKIRVSLCHFSIQSERKVSVDFLLKLKHLHV